MLYNGRRGIGMATKNIARQVVLQNTLPGHNKYYEITIRRMEKSTDLIPAYYVEARWGRIEHFKDGNPQSQVKAENVYYETANATLGDLLYAKLKKGYKTVQDTASGHQSNEYAGKVATKKAEVQQVETKPFERTEHVEVAPIDWWNKLGEAIEDRVV
jgi:predicted DNA-binding WGR domain protein